MLSTAKIWWNLDRAKVTNSYFKFWVIENPWNYEIGTGPHVSCLHCLTGRAGRVRVCDTVHGVSIVTVHRQWPLPYVQPDTPPWPSALSAPQRRKSPFHPWPSSSLVPLLCSTLHYRPPLCSLWLATTKSPPCHPTGPKGAPWCRAPPASSSSPGHRLPKPSNRGSRATVYLREELTIDRHHLSTSILITTSRRTARVCSSTTSTPSPPPTSGPRCHRRPPPSSSLTAARSLWWAPFHPTTTHEFPVV
jgi:hypothetical protein